MEGYQNTNAKQASSLLAYVNESITPFHAVKAAKDRLDKVGFIELPLCGTWNLQAGGKYYVEIFKKTVAAFTVGEEISTTGIDLQQLVHSDRIAKENEETKVSAGQPQIRLRMAAAHTDYPCLHIKPKAEMSSANYLKLNTEVYGGPILNTWFDRPLSIAGLVAVRTENAFAPEIRLFDAKKPVLTLPNLAIHMNRDVNNGVEIKKQQELIPLMGQLAKKEGEASEKAVGSVAETSVEAPAEQITGIPSEKSAEETIKNPAVTSEFTKTDFFVKFLAKQLKIVPEDILDFDLFVYNTEEGCLIGMEEEFISAPRLDNLTSCYAVLNALIENPRKTGINIGILFDHEEIGSRSKQGADSAVISMLLEKLYDVLGLGQTALKEDILSGFLLSADVAHAVHPNRTDKYDPINQASMNDGVVLKINSGQRYTFDTEAIASVVHLCEQNKIPYKKFVNHSDVAGGGTLGPIISSWLPMKTVDIGVPMLAMHSARELMGVKDQDAITRLIGTFFGQE